MKAYVIIENEDEPETRVFAENEEHAVHKYIDYLEAFGGTQGIRSLKVRRLNSNKEIIFEFPQ